jgi:hypothetical protein
MNIDKEKLSILQKLEILREECPTIGLGNLAMVLYKGFTDKIKEGYELQPHDVRYIEDMWLLRQKV